MDSLITAAARALAQGDPLGALNRVALREDAPALALRGIAMAQLGDLTRAKMLLRKAARAFGPKEAVARARCVVAEAEVALAARDLAWPAKALDAAREILEDHGDRVNAAHARYLELRRHLLLGRLDEAERHLQALDPVILPPPLRTAHELLTAGIAMRRLKAKPARDALQRAAHAAKEARIPALASEVAAALHLLAAPAARQLSPGPERLLDLAGVEAVLASKALVIDACRLVVVQGKTQVALARRPVLFALVQALGEAAPGDVARDVLIARYQRNRRRSAALFAMLADEAYYSQPIVLRHPIVFYEGHLPGFSFNTIVKKALGGPSIDVRLESLFARGIDPHESDDGASGSRVSGWPSRDEVRAFADEADAQVLAALPGMTSEKLQSVLSQRGNPALDPRALVATAGSEGATHVGSRAYRVTVEVELADGRRSGAEIVILLLESGDEPYRVLSWRNASDESTAPQKGALR